MRTHEQTLELDCGKLAPTFTQRLMAGLAPLATALRIVRNRSQVNGLYDLDDNQLRDIGLTRADVTSAFLASTFFEDPSEHLTQAAKRRWRIAVMRPYRD
ncbi:uncharacterized protein YjiS (DUF1127 family) [Rhizobium sp. BK196]|jgi:uncharacterized protein YjiS (DUF1127 family)|uniref:DUF1127 domain-containing protein n=1 Tax=unclassified Rhizobium TaxID=2613769 RepID=UPI00161D1599|nr:MULTISPECIES: DUF1127 domain-containing protein [unclassified Rhizobium]MBB3313121.1 uncharacterized protein YjiS (DUF1127 family) [Rhizobium sp. BK196]MBB3460456.1 uncharacterized protein YjiS (DUF1127 family) [Rhizobium sp. BK377]